MMEKYKIEDFKRGWVVGNFRPSLSLSDTEVGVQKYKAKEEHGWHYHRFAEEINIILDGKCEFLEAEGDIYTGRTGEIVKIPSKTVYSFVAVEPTTIVCIKTASNSDDKVELSENEDPFAIQAQLWDNRAP